MHPNVGKLTTLLGSASLVAMYTASAAQAQQMAQGAEEAPETVLVTGSLIRGTVAVGEEVEAAEPHPRAVRVVVRGGDGVDGVRPVGRGAGVERALGDDPFLPAFRPALLRGREVGRGRGGFEPVIEGGHGRGRELGDGIRRWILELALHDPARLAQFVAIHEVALKSLVRHDDELARFIVRWLSVAI